MEKNWSNVEFEKYSRAIVKLLGEGLKNGEYFLYSKDGEYGMILSEERIKGISLSEDNKQKRILKILQEDVSNNGWFTGKADKYTMQKI